MAASAPALLSPARREKLRAIARRVVPESAGLDALAEGDFFRTIEEALLPQQPETVRQLLLFVDAVDFLPLLRHGRRFRSLSPDRQDAWLAWLEGAPVALLRKGFWGLRTLVFLGYYGRPEAGAALGYGPSRSGNEMLSRA